MSWFENDDEVWKRLFDRPRQKLRQKIIWISDFADSKQYVARHQDYINQIQRLQQCEALLQRYVNVDSWSRSSAGTEAWKLQCLREDLERFQFLWIFTIFIVHNPVAQDTLTYFFVIWLTFLVLGYLLVLAIYQCAIMARRRHWQVISSTYVCEPANAKQGREGEA